MMGQCHNWELGEDLSLVVLGGVEYRLTSTMTVAAPDTRERIASRGLRELLRVTGLSQHTIKTIRDGQPVRARTLQRLLAALA